VCVYGTLMESDSVEPSGRTEGDTRPGRTRRKPKNLSVCESEERGRGEGGGVYGTLMDVTVGRP
jgi:hypothetical protein